MADITTGYKRIVTNRKFSDYESMRKYFSEHYPKGIKEIIFSGFQLQTAGAGVIIDGSQLGIGTQAAAAGIAYIATEVDDGNQDGAKVWVTYQDNTGAIHGPIEHLLNASDPDVEHAIGNENVIDTVAVVDGTFKIITLTALNPGLNGYAGKYMVCYSGDQKGTAHLINSNSADDPTVLTLDTASAANLAADLVQIQTYPCTDYFRTRELYCEVEPIDTKMIELGTHDTGVIYAGIGGLARYMANSGFFTQPAATCRSFLGKVKSSHSIDSTVTELTGASVFITFTPLAANANGDSADVTIELTFSDSLEWEPCIELEPATDVIVKISNMAGAALDNQFVEITYLEAYLIV